MNIVILAGALVAPPARRESLDGSHHWSFDLATVADETTLAAAGLPVGRLSVPVVWSTDSVPAAWDNATELVVSGVARRRFFRAGGATQSRTEVVAVAVVEVTKRRSVARALERAVAALGPADLARLRST